MMLSENIRILAQVIHEVCQRNTRKESCSVPLTRNQIYILRMLAQAGEMPIGEIARTLEISNAAASKNIDRLQDWGFVARRTRKRDRRSFQVGLQDAGRQVVASYDEIQSRKQLALMDQFTEEEKTVLLGLVGRVIRHTLADEHNTDLICQQCGNRCGEECVVSECRGECKAPEKN